MTDDDQETREILRQGLSARLSNAKPSAVWEALVEAGVVGLRIQKKYGGLELSLADSLPVFQVLGELCMPSNFLERCIVIPGLLRPLDTQEAQSMQRKLTEQSFFAAVAGLEEDTTEDLALSFFEGTPKLSGRANLVLDAPAVDTIIMAVLGAGGLALVSCRREDGEILQTYPTIDGRNAADMIFDNAPCIVLAEDCGEVVEGAIDEAIACISIEASALMKRLVAETTDYVRARIQFGQPIGNFQAIQHRLVDMHIAARRADAIARQAVVTLDRKTGNAPIVSAAKVTIAETSRFVAQNAVQLHGGMGMTEELSVGRYFKRLTVIEQQFGAKERHLSRYWGQIDLQGSQA